MMDTYFIVEWIEIRDALDRTGRMPAPFLIIKP